MYVRLLEEKQADGKIQYVESDKYAVFEESDLDKAIRDAWKRHEELRKLKKMAQTHTMLIAEKTLREYGIPFEIKPFVEKHG